MSLTRRILTDQTSRPSWHDYSNSTSSVKKEKKKRIKKNLSSLVDSNPSHPNAVYWSQFSRLNRQVFFWENVFRMPRKPWLWTEKKPEDTSSTVFEVWTALKYCELKYCADRVRSRSNNKDEVLNGKFSDLNFLPSILLNFFFPFIDIILVFFSVLNFTSVELNHFAK